MHVRKDECQCNASDVYIPERLLCEKYMYTELERHKIKTINKNTH
jgi:hypothetical protein